MRSPVLAPKLTSCIYNMSGIRLTRLDRGYSACWLATYHTDSERQVLVGGETGGRLSQGAIIQVWACDSGCAATTYHHALSVLMSTEINLPPDAVKHKNWWVGRDWGLWFTLKTSGRATNNPESNWRNMARMNRRHNRWHKGWHKGQGLGQGRQSTLFKAWQGTSL